ncbi:MAG: PfkB family carbohydrate kinase [Sphaerochaetaceae bacterium]|jgi:sugar/nucleoside kinase (ribokinase family)/beta-phosphoglucomutase-like phosphatase (HAD superfamily)
MKLDNTLETEIKKKTFAVVGDVALDLVYFTAPGDDRSVETGLAIHDVTKYAYDAGAAGNLAMDIASLGARCDLYGIHGDDCWAEILLDRLGSYGIGTEGFVTDEHSTTPVYHKVYDENLTELPRYDIGGTNEYLVDTLDRICSILEQRLETYDALLVNQQFLRTIHVPYFRTRLSTILSRTNKPVWLDTRADIRYPNCSYKMNSAEAMARTGLQNAEAAMHALYHDLGRQQDLFQIVVTLGENGAIGFDGKELTQVLGINSVQKTDPVGAGDAFLAALACVQACGRTFRQAMEFANYNAALSARTLQATGHPTCAEMLELAKSPDYRYNPTLAIDTRQAKFLPGTEIEIINSNTHAQSYPSIAIFDHDGTISTMRQGWETIMQELMVEAVIGDATNLTDENRKSVHKAVADMIEKTTGIQTIMQMAQLIELIKEFGFVPPVSIKTPLEYKMEYSRRLSKLLDVKYDRFRAGIYDVTDMTMKGSLDFLQRLRSHETSIFLASGSDYADVKYETDTFGYSRYFDGGIYGSVSDISNDPKKLVMENIVRQIHVSPSQVVVFGDGPVEIREGKKRGFLTVGIVSDEQQRFGINPKKRERLVLAGADILIPDYSWTAKLAKYVGWEQ